MLCQVRKVRLTNMDIIIMHENFLWCLEYIEYIEPFYQSVIWLTAYFFLLESSMSLKLNIFNHWFTSGAILKAKY